MIFCARLWYVGACIIVDSNACVGFQRQLFQFLWHRSTELIRRLTLIRPAIEGGLGIFHLETRFAAMRCLHIKQLICNYGAAKWHAFAEYWVGLSLRHWKPEFLCNARPHSFDRPTFYDVTLADFRRLSQRQPGL